MLGERDVVGVGTDTLSLDPGNSEDLAIHSAWLPAGRYGIENLAGLGEVVPSGATIVVGAPKHEGATGGTLRAFALSPAGSLPHTGGPAPGAPSPSTGLLPDTGGPTPTVTSTPGV